MKFEVGQRIQCTHQHSWDYARKARIIEIEGEICRIQWESPASLASHSATLILDILHRSYMLIPEEKPKKPKLTCKIEVQKPEDKSINKQRAIKMLTIEE